MIHFDNTSPVKLKGTGGGLWLSVDPSFSHDELMEHIDKVFNKLGHLTINASVVVDFGTAKGHEEFIDVIRNHLCKKYQVKQVGLPPRKPSIPTSRIRQRDMSKGWQQHKSDVLMLRGRIRSGQKIEARKHVVITGDVNPGARIFAGGDVIVLGKLSGNVHAGQPDNSKAIVFALEFSPTHVQIGKIAVAGSDEKSAGFPEFACVEDNQIIVSDYMKASPFRKLPWPETI